MTINCDTCKKDLSTDFFKSPGRPPKLGGKPVKLTTTCSICRMKVQNRNGARAAHERSKLLRIEILKRYEAKCACCEITEIEFLTIDHVQGNGAKERRELSDHQIYRKIILEDFPTTYQVLCMNCNWAKGRLGVCPHKKFSRDV